MSGVWSTATLDLSIPSNKTPAPGSGVLYIGGPQLPAELRAASYTAAIVWFTDDPAGDVKYWFQARRTIPGVGDFWNIGYCLTSGVLLPLDSDVYNNAGNRLERVLDANELALNGDGASILLGTPTVYGGPMIKAKPGWGFDEWDSTSRTRTIGGVANCTVNVDWRITIDYIIDVRIYITCPSAPGVGSGTVDVALPPRMPQPDYSPSVGPRGPYGILLGAGGSNQANYVARIDTGYNMVIFVNGNAPGNRSFEGSMTFTVPK